MKSLQKSSRIDIGDLKAQLVKKIGSEKSKQYLYYLNSFFNQKLSKRDFDKLCSRVLGRENLPLHNLFILSILKNACNGETSTPSLHEAGAAKSAIQTADTRSPPSAIKPNGAVSPISPRRGRSRKLRDRPSPLGPFGKSLSYQSTTTDDSGGKVMMETGDSTPCDYLHPTKHLQGIDDRCENQAEVTGQQTLSRESIKKLYGGHGSLYSKDQIEAGLVEDGEEVEQPNQLFVAKTPLIAPLGIPFCSASLGGQGRPLRVPSSNNYVRYCDSGCLSSTATLKMRMEKIALLQGLEGVSIDSAAMLNNMLDVYLKRLIKSSFEFAGARSGPEPNMQPSNNQLIQNKLPNGMCASNHLYMQNVHKQKTSSSISLLDFKVATEQNPQQHGENWPLLLEKICTHQFEE